MKPKRWGLSHRSKVSPGFSPEDLPSLMEYVRKLSWCPRLVVLFCYIMVMGKTPGESYLEGELVHWVDPAEVIHDEVEQRCPGSCWPIVLPSLIDFHFG